MARYIGALLVFLPPAPLGSGFALLTAAAAVSGGGYPLPLLYSPGVAAAAAAAAGSMKASISAARLMPIVSLAYGSRRALFPIYRMLTLLTRGRRYGSPSSSYAAAAVSVSVSPYIDRGPSRGRLSRVPLAVVAAGFHAATLIPVLSALRAEGGVIGGGGGGVGGGVGGGDGGFQRGGEAGTAIHLLSAAIRWAGVLIAALG